MSGLGLDSKAFVLSIVVHAALAAGFMVTHPFGAPDRPEFEIISVSLSSPQEKPKVVQQQAPPPPPPKQEEKPKPKPEPEKKPPKAKAEEKTQPTETKPAETKVEERIDEGEAEPEEVLSYAEAGAAAAKESEFSHAEFSGTFDAPGFSYPDWNYRGFEKIARAWNNRAFSTRPLTCTIHFYVLSSGRVHSISIKESSGNPVYDRGCKQAVERAAPLPPLPKDFGHEEVGISLVFPYKP